MIDTLVLSGGGIKIIYYLGLQKYLEENNLLQNIDTFIGCSAGSIFCLLLTLELTYDELLKIFNNINFDKNINYDFINFFENYGICDSDFIINILSIIIKNKLNIDNSNNLTFLDLYNINKNKLLINGSNITDKKCEIFSYENTPNMKVLDAIKISINIPFFLKK